MAQTITFSKVGDAYEATFEAGSNFALHIERAEAGLLSMGITSVEGTDYANVEDFPERARYMRVFDYEFAGIVFPKYIKVTSATQPTSAAVTFAE